jgi:hypothetical protein
MAKKLGIHIFIKKKIKTGTNEKPVLNLPPITIETHTLFIQVINLITESHQSDSNLISCISTIYIT